MKRVIILKALLALTLPLSALAMKKTTISLTNNHRGKTQIYMESKVGEKTNSLFFVNFEGIAGGGTNDKRKKIFQDTQKLIDTMNLTKKIFQQEEPSCLELFLNIFLQKYVVQEMIFTIEKNHNGETEETFQHRIFIDKNNFYLKKTLDQTDEIFKKQAKSIYNAYKKLEDLQNKKEN